MTQISPTTQDELTHRHRTAALFVAASLIFTLLLVAIAFIESERINRPGDPSLVWALRIAILIFGLGAFVLRRTRFTAMRLQDIAAVRGVAALIATLQSTTIQLAFIGGAIALMGFIVTILTGDPLDMLRGAGVSIIVLLYCYPRRKSWSGVVRGVEQLNDENDPPVKGSVT